MRKHWRMALAISFFVTIGGITWLVLNLVDSEPAYQGKYLSAWLLEYAESGEAESQAEVAIRAIGTNGIPVLVKWMGCKDSKLKAKLISMVRKQSLVKIRCYTDKECHLIARVSFGVLGSNAAPAVPALINLLQNNNDVDIQGETVMAFGRIGPAAIDAMPAIIACLHGTNHFAALFAPNTLALIHQQAEIVVPALIRHLEESRQRPMHLQRTIKAIGDFGGEATAAIPAVTAYLEDPDEKTRSFATNALKQINGEAAKKTGVR